MGCDNSQTTGPQPHDPHLMPQQHKEKPSELQQVSPQPDSSNNNPGKENSKPRESTVRSKRASKVGAEGATEDKKQFQSENRLEDIPMVDKTNMNKESLTSTQNGREVKKRESKVLSERKVVQEEASVGPSSKSIERVPSQENVGNTGVEGFPITSVLQQSQKGIVSLEKVPEPEPVAESLAPKVESSELVIESPAPKVQPQQQTFKLDQFDAKQSLSMSRNVQIEEVEAYLNQLMNFQSYSDAVIAKMQEKQKLRYEIPV